jgi:hypothetical protein
VRVTDEDQKLLCTSSCHVEPLWIRQEAEVVLVVELDKLVAARDKEENIAVSLDVNTCKMIHNLIEITKSKMIW